MQLMPNKDQGLSELTGQAAKNDFSRGFYDATIGYKAAQTNIADSASHGTTSNLDSAYRGAAAAFKDVMNNTLYAGQKADSSSVYQAAYTKALAEARMIANKAAADYSNNKDYTGTQTYDAATKAYTVGRSDAIKGYQAALANPSDKTYTSESNKDEVFRGTVDGYNAVVNHKTSDAGKNVNDTNQAYLAAYNKAFNEATSYAENGATAFGNAVDLIIGRNNLGSNQAAKMVYSVGYQDANQAYQAAQSNPTDASSHSSNSNFKATTVQIVIWMKHIKVLQLDLMM